MSANKVQCVTPHKSTVCEEAYTWLGNPEVMSSVKQKRDWHRADARYVLAVTTGSE